MTLDKFLAAHLQALEKDQARHNLMLGILNRAKKDPSKVRLWSMGDGAACAVQTPPHYIVLGDLTGDQWMRLADFVKDLDFAGCNGPDDSSEIFAKSLLKVGIPLGLAMPQRIYLLDRKPTYPKCAGEGRRAGAADLELFLDWFHRFSREAVPDEKPHSREKMTEMFHERPVFFWSIEGVPVSMAARTRETKGGSNISLVYSPPEYRGKGYAGAATAFACDDVFKEGKKTCFLYTDLRNPISNRIYQKIGFKPWCDSKYFSRIENFYQCRPATADDFEFVKKIHHETLREYVEPIWGWTEAKQDQFVRDWFKPEKVEILQHEGKDVGILAIERRADELFLGSISLAPGRQGEGIGAVVIRGVMDRARKEKLPLRLQVLKTNPKARRLYERLGFLLEKETTNHYELKYD